MRRNLTHLEEIQMIGKLADLKEEHYKVNLLMSAMTELFIEKGLLTSQELQERITMLDLYGTPDVSSGNNH